MKTLRQPVSLGAIAMANRYVMAPMTRSRARSDGTATALMATYYAQRASAGLIISEGIQPSATGQGFAGTPGLHTAQQVQSWKLVTRAVHEAGGRIVAQLMHAGRIGHPALYPSAHAPTGPSAIAAQGKTYTKDGMLDYPVPEALSAQAIEATIVDFAVAARNAIAAGFDGVELHAGNGFLLHQFMAENTNLRDDAYGGTLAKRVKFTVDVAHAVADSIGAGRVGMRISPANPYNDIAEGDSFALYEELLARLPDLAFLHIMEAHCRTHSLAVRRQWRGALVLNPHESAAAGAVSGAIAQAVLEQDLADAVAFGALFLANPDLPARIEAGGPFNVLDQHTLYGGDHRGFIDYPFLKDAP